MQFTYVVLFGIGPWLASIDGHYGMPNATGTVCFVRVAMCAEPLVAQHF